MSVEATDPAVYNAPAVEVVTTLTGPLVLAPVVNQETHWTRRGQAGGPFIVDVKLAPNDVYDAHRLAVALDARVLSDGTVRSEVNTSDQRNKLIAKIGAVLGSALPYAHTTWHPKACSEIAALDVARTGRTGFDGTFGGVVVPEGSWRVQEVTVGGEIVEVRLVRA